MRLSTFDCQIVDGICQNDHYSVRTTGQIARFIKSEGPGGEGRLGKSTLNQNPSEVGVKAAVVSWWATSGSMKQHEKATEEAKLMKVPANLDHTYLDVCVIRAPPARTWCRGHFSRFQHNKVFIMRRGRGG
jgi:hypothetical protein